ncbi:MAG TPA: hypothetical protein EYP14_13340 [Planctomycetaceae bacterium]|nr:hypothetical protein [Planctomycetaceae bacterium]
MAKMSTKIVLGSRSPRRRELLRLIVPEDRILILPPRNSDEPGFEGRQTWDELENRVKEIARTKCRDVLEQLHQGDAIRPQETGAVITADTVIVATDPNGRPVVLGQPEPAGDHSWQDVVRRWFQDYYAGRSHAALTALCVAVPSGRQVQRLARSDVTFRADIDQWLDWYLQTGEPLGKAGGYGIQGAADLFVARVEGSISNVVGLPLRELLETLEELGLDVGPPSLSG